MGDNLGWTLGLLCRLHEDEMSQDMENTNSSVLFWGRIQNAFVINKEKKEENKINVFACRDLVLSAFVSILVFRKCLLMTDTLSSSENITSR